MFKCMCFFMMPRLSSVLLLALDKWVSTSKALTVS